MKKKISAILLMTVLVVALLCIPALASSGAAFSAANTQALTTDETVQVPVTITANPGLAVGRVDVQWDETVLELAGITYGGGLGQDNGSPMEGEVDEDGEPTSGIVNDGSYPVSFGSYLATEDWETTGTLFTLHFNIKEGAAAGQYPITLSGKADDFLNVAIEEQTVSFTAGEVWLKVPQVAQSIVGPDNIEATYGDGPLTLNYTAEGAIDYVVTDGLTVIEVEDGKLVFKKAGAATLKVRAAAVEAEGYLSAEKIVTVKVNQASQTITGDDTITGTYGDAAVTLAYSGVGDITYELADDEDVISISEGKLTFLKAGTTSFEVKAGGDENYLAAEKTIAVTVDKADQTITLGADTMTAKAGGAAQELPSAEAETSISYTVTSGTDVIEIVEGKVNFLKAGNAVITVAAEETAQYNAASETITVTVEKADQTITGDDAIIGTYGDAPVELTYAGAGAITYELTADETVISISDGMLNFLKSGETSFTVKAAGDENYAAAELIVNVTVSKANQTITLSTDTMTAKVNGAAQELPSAEAETTITYEVTSGTDVIEIVDGKVNFLKAGNAVITVTAEETAQYKKASETITVTVADLPVQEIICDDEITLTYGEAFTMTAEAEGDITYAITDGVEIIEIHAETGVVTINKVGTAEITITAAATDEYAPAAKVVNVTVSRADYTFELSVDTVYTAVNPSEEQLQEILTPIFNAPSGVNGEAVQVSMAMYKDSACTELPESDLFENVGTTTLYVQVKASESSNYTMEPKVVALTITVVADGDVNCDGKISAADAMILARYVSGWEDYDTYILCPAAADIDGEAGITGNDAMKLARYLAGWSGVTL